MVQICFENFFSLYFTRNCTDKKHKLLRLMLNLFFEVCHTCMLRCQAALIQKCHEGGSTIIFICSVILLNNNENTTHDYSLIRTAIRHTAITSKYIHTIYITTY